MMESAALADGCFRLTVLRPVAPVMAWLERMRDAALAGAAPRTAVLDLGLAPLHGPGLQAVLAALNALGIRVVGLTGVSAEALGPEAARLPPVLAPVAGEARVPAVPSGLAAPLFHGRSLRSGQVLEHPGAVTVRGNVSSGAEIIAGGWIHVLGVLTGRAMTRDPEGRIFCERFGAELVAIGGVFLTADRIAEDVKGRPAMVWRAGDRLEVSVLEA